MACKTVSVLGAATQQVAIPSRLPQTQSDWQTFVQQLNTLFSQLSTTARRPAATSVPIQYATLFSSTLPPLQTTNCTVTADNSWSLFGGFSYKIVVTGSNASVVCGASGFPLPIPPNENWLLSVYGKCSGASQSFKMGLQTANNTYQNTVITDATATTVDRFAIPLNLVADDASQCTLRLDFPSASGQTFWFDGFQYEPSVSGSINPSPFLSTNIIAGSIVAQFITVAQLSALSANMGTLTAGKIQSSDGRFTIDCTNELITITDGTNTRMQIGQVSAGVYDVKIWNGSDTLLFDAATGLQYAGNSTQVTQVINDNSGNGQLNVNPTGGVVSTLPYANHDVSVKNTIVSAPDGNGSYLGHGVVFQPHIHANQIGWGHFIGDTSGNYSGNLVDGLNLRFLHGAMSGPTQNTVAGTADGNGSYLQHGVVFNPHLTGGAVGWKNLLGDTSGDTTTNLIDAANKRFLHGAMSTGVQGVISSGSQVNVNPSGGVTGNLPYLNHDLSVRTTLASTAGGDGSYLQAVIFNRHLANANAAGLNYTAGGTVDSFKPQEAGANVTETRRSASTTSLSNHVISDNLLPNGNFTNGFEGWTFPSGWTLSQYNTGAGMTGMGAFINTITTEQKVMGVNLVPVDQNKTYLLEAWVYCSSAGAAHYLGFAEYDMTGAAVLHQSAGATYGYALISNGSINGYQYFAAEVSGNGGTSPTAYQFNQATASIVPVWLANYGDASVSEIGIQQFRISEVAAGSRRGLQSTTPGTGNYKAYADFTDNTAGGHLGKSNWADATQMGTNIQGGTSLTDGETITFANAYSADPEIVFGDGGLTYDSTLGAVSQFQDFSASFTHSGGQTTGFTAALKISTVGGALTPHSQNFSQTA